jgi:flavin reductase (DIM6/NTAB) family NADH-FMN oxidoreductase RutF
MNRGLRDSSQTMTPDISTYRGDISTLRRAFAGFPSGVVALAAIDDVGEPLVMLASSFVVGVSQDPPLVVFAAQHTSSTWPILSRAPHLGVSVLSEKHLDKCRQLAGPDRSRRLDGIGSSTRPSGAVLLEDCPVRFECSVHDIHRAGDHDLVVLEVLEIEEVPDHRPLVWHHSAFTRLAG